MRTLSMPTVLLCLVCLASTTLVPIPGLYLDKMTIGSISGATYLPVTGGYNFTFAWRTSLATRTSIGLGLYNFEAGVHKFMSFEGVVVVSNASSMIVNINPVATDSGINYLAFSVIVITENNNFVELLWDQHLNANSWSYNVTSQKFTFGNGTDPQVLGFFQWVTAFNVSAFTLQTNYWAYLSYSLTGNNQITFQFSHDSTYLKGFRVNFLLVNNSIQHVPLMSYKTLAADGSSWTRQFSNNLGIDTALFGEPFIGEMCLFGLEIIDLYFYSFPSDLGNCSFLFTFTGPQITNLNYVYVYGVEMAAACFGYTGNCSVGFYYDTTLTSCTACQAPCNTCLNATYCLFCPANHSLVTANNTQSCKKIPGLISLVSQTNEPGGVNIMLIIGITVAVVVFVIILLIIWCLCRNASSSAAAGSGQEQLASSQDYVAGAQNQDFDTWWTSNKLDRQWKPENDEGILDQDCSICLGADPDVISGCGHYFHLGCISNRSLIKKCPDCERSLRHVVHRIACVECGENSLKISFEGLKKIALNGRYQDYCQCLGCKEKQSELEG